MIKQDQERKDCSLGVEMNLRVIRAFRNMEAETDF
jgi:hypothetical protein